MSEARPPGSEPENPARCPWVSGVPEFVPYHDDEWGVPTSDDARLFEQMSLESFQSGLSWRTILNKRPAFRRAFENFQPDRVERFSQADVARLLADPGIVRHRGKIEATIHNASVLRKIRNRSGSLAAFVWRFEPDGFPPVRGDPSSNVTETVESRALSKALRQEGWRFFGPTTTYAFMQAAGLVNGHTHACWCRPRTERARAAFERPL
jgi:DNA-3-methyladenine glycosylase I